MTFPLRSGEFLPFNAPMISVNHLIRSTETGSQNRKVEAVMVVQAPNPSDFIRTTTQPDTNAAKMMDPAHIPRKKNPPL